MDWNPSHTYQKAGTYAVTLKVTDTNDETASLVSEVTVHPIDANPEAHFKYTQPQSHAAGKKISLALERDLDETSFGKINWYSLFTCIDIFQFI